MKVIFIDKTELMIKSATNFSTNHSGKGLRFNNVDKTKEVDELEMMFREDNCSTLTVVSEDGTTSEFTRYTQVDNITKTLSDDGVTSTVSLSIPTTEE